MATTWEWKDDIDEERANKSKERAEAMLAQSDLSEQEYKLAEFRLKRALVRLDVKN